MVHVLGVDDQGSLLDEPLQVLDTISPASLNQFVLLVQLLAWRRMQQGLVGTRQTRLPMATGVAGSATLIPRCCSFLYSVKCLVRCDPRVISILIGTRLQQRRGVSRKT